MSKGALDSQLLFVLGLTPIKQGFWTTDSWRALLGKAARVLEPARPRKDGFLSDARPRLCHGEEASALSLYRMRNMCIGALAMENGKKVETKNSSS